MTVVVDANTVIYEFSASRSISRLSELPATAPPLLWPELRSAMHVLVTRGDFPEDAALDLIDEMERGWIAVSHHPELARSAWRIANQLGWRKTYDAEYLALARQLDAPLLTWDGRMRRASERLGIELHPLPE